MSKKAFYIPLLGIVSLIIIFTFINHRKENYETGRAKQPTAEKAEIIPKISAHEHYRFGGNMDSYIAAMDKTGIVKAIFVPTGRSPNNSGYIENFEELSQLVKKYSGKIYWFATAWSLNPNAPNILEEQIKLGAKGIKFIDWHGDFEGNELDSDLMYEVYELANSHNLPILLHVDLQKNPVLIAKIEKVAKDFPNVKFILAHYCRTASGETPRLEICDNLLGNFSNIYADISMGGGLKRYVRYFDNDAEQFRNFIIKNQNKLMWGTDIILDLREDKTSDWLKNRMIEDFSMLGQDSYSSIFYPEDQTIHKGLNLPKEVLAKLYYENPLKILETVFKE